MSEDDKKVYEKLGASMEVLAKSVDTFNNTIVSIVSITEKKVKRNNKDDAEKTGSIGKVIQFTLVTGATIIGIVIIVKGAKMLLRKANDR